MTGHRPLGGGNDPDITVEANQDEDCFSIRQPEDDGIDDLVHICDWPSMKATIDAFQRERGGRT